MIFTNNMMLMLVALILASIFIFVLYSIIMYKGNKGGKGSELQLSTKNILEQVKVLFDTGEYALVELLATKYLDRVPTHQGVREYLAKAYFRRNKFNNCIKQCLIILKKDPNNIETRQLLGDCYIKKQMLGKAIKEYELIYEYRSTDKDVLKTLAELYKDTEQLYSSITVYNMLTKLIDNNEEMAEVQDILADLNEEVHDYPAAFEAYKTKLGIYPNDIQTNHKLAELYIKLKNYPKAIETLLFMLSFVIEAKHLLWIYEYLVDLYVETEDYEKAIEYSNKLLEVQGSDKFKIRKDIAQFNLKLDNYSTGISILEELVMMSQNGYDVTTELAMAYIKQKQFEKALEQYLALLDKATQKEAKSVRLLIADLYITWAIDETEKGDFEKSYSLLDKAAEYNLINSEIYYNKAQNNILQKNYANAIEFLQRALEYDKFKENHTKYYLKLAEAHHYLGNFFEEKKALSDLLKIDENNPQGLYRSGLMYMSQHVSKDAEECFKRALEYDPDLIDAKFNLALLYESNNKEKAKELYMEVLEQNPGYEDAKNALADMASSDY